MIPILARLLAPEDFGVVAAALTVIALFLMLKDGGVGAALIQQQQLTKKHIEAAFSFSVLLGVVLSVFLFLTAPLVADFYDEEGVTPLVRALSVMFLLRGIAAVPQALARRDMQFRALAIIDVMSYAAGTAIVITCAFLGLGAWALVVGYLVETLITTVWLVAIRPVKYTFVPQVSAIRELLRFGAGHNLSLIAIYFANQGDNMVVGRVLGAAALGFYTRAYDLMRYPSVVFSNIAGSVLFSAFARMQESREQLGRAFRQATFGTTVVLAPLSASLVVLAPEFIAILLGDDWQAATVPFQIMALSMVPRTTFKIGETIARAAGTVYRIAILHVLYGAMVIGGAAFSVQWGILGVAVTTTIAVYVNFVLASWLGLHHCDLDWRGFIGAHLQPLLVTAAVLACVWPVAELARGLELHAIWTLLAASAVGLGAGLAALAVGVRCKHADWIWLVERVRDKRRKPRG